MATTNIMPVFKSQEEKNIVMATIAISILLGLTGYLALIAPIVAYFGLKGSLSANGKEIVRALANFEIFICIASVILGITVVGIPLIFLLGIYALIVTLIALFAVINNTEIKIPVFFEFIKANAEETIISANKDNNEN